MSKEGSLDAPIRHPIDFEHPDFLNPDSTTRVLELWDQTINFRRNRSINKHHQSRSRTIYFDHN